MTVDRRIEEPEDQFPIGMRVLAVDDDPTCLKLLETLLRRCQYHVTTTSQARTALNMLRENKNNFDLVISDVHMPDMDGFKLLELVGLEMDLPVIMLSANGDSKLVMRGINHGACDYLLKPVRIEELKNVWQHVIRRKKFDPKKSKNSSANQDMANGGDGDPASGGYDHNGKGLKRRKDQNDDDDEDQDDNGEDNDDPSSQKKPRVVWSVELHRKFVAAVNQLGIDKAVPKKILDLMNVEKLTRENVASHLQKYRLYLKRLNCAANQQANMVAAFGSSDPSYLRMNSMNFNPIPLSMSVPYQNQQQFRNVGPVNNLIGRLNSPANLGLRGMVQMTGSVGHNPGMIQGVSIPYELDHHRNNKCGSQIGEISTTIDDPTVFSPPNALGIANNMLTRDFGNQSLKSEYCSTTTDSWSNPASSSGFQSSSFPLNDRFKNPALQNSLRGNQFDGSSHNSIADTTQCQASGIGVQPWDHPNPNMSNSLIPINSDAIVALDNSLASKSSNVFHRGVDFNSMGQPSYVDASAMVRYDPIEKSTMDAKLNGATYQQQQRPQSGYVMNSFGSLGDVVSSTMKQEHVKGGDFDGFS